MSEKPTLKRRLAWTAVVLILLLAGTVWFLLRRDVTNAELKVSIEEARDVLVEKVDRVLANQELILANQRQAMDGQNRVLATVGATAAKQDEVLAKLDEVLANVRPLPASDGMKTKGGE